MQILHVSSEVAPFAKVGGLADVVMGLSRNVQAKGHDVHIIIPSYQCIDRDHLLCTGRVETFTTQLHGRSHTATVSYFLFDEKISVLLLDTEDGYWSQLTSIYGDDVERFTFFCRAVADWLNVTQLSPDIIHLHDWPAALLPVVAPIRGYTKGRFVLTMHNFESQGRCTWEEISSVGICPENVEETLLQDPDGSSLNLVKGGLLSCDRVTTVSPTYAKEVMTAEFGLGLESVLKGIQKKFSGVLNGIDTSYWDPQTDGFLFQRYHFGQGYEKICAAKQYNKKALFDHLQLPLKEGTPLLSGITRLVPQKGIWLLHELLSQAEELDFQVILLGSVPVPAAEAPFKELDMLLRKQGRGAVLFGCDEKCAHRLFAASDIFVAPSLFEPCGLTQLISFRYGTVPVVRRTGGFSDTVVDVSKGDEANGFSFTSPLSSSFRRAVIAALEWYQHKEWWKDLVMRGMAQDFSWEKPSEEYIDLYHQTLV